MSNLFNDRSGRSFIKLHEVKLCLEDWDHEVELYLGRKLSEEGYQHEAQVDAYWELCAGVGRKGIEGRSFRVLMVQWGDGKTKVGEVLNILLVVSPGTV